MGANRSHLPEQVIHRRRGDQTGASRLGCSAQVADLLHLRTLPKPDAQPSLCAEGTVLTPGKAEEQSAGRSKLQRTPSRPSFGRCGGIVSETQRQLQPKCGALRPKCGSLIDGNKCRRKEHKVDRHLCRVTLTLGSVLRPPSLHRMGRTGQAADRGKCVEGHMQRLWRTRRGRGSGSD